MAEKFRANYDPEEHEKRMVIVHADMHPGNIFYDPKTSQLSLIDIGCGQKYQIETAFAQIAKSYSAGFTEKFLKAYSEKSGMDVTLKQIETAHCLYVTLNMQGAVKRGDEAGISAIRNYVDEYREKRLDHDPLVSPSSKSEKRLARKL